MINGPAAGATLMGATRRHAIRFALRHDQLAVDHRGALI